jgi:hypothetical protein
MVDHEPLSIRQLQQVNEDVVELVVRAEELARLMLTAHGPNDDVAVRGQDIRDAIQRFQGAMERRQSKIMSVSA